MSPGYDFPQHWGFERPVQVGCVVCHAGRVEAAGRTTHGLTFHEKAIGCENCHGPGSLHRDLRRARKPEPGEDDRTIVHPGKLSRPLREAVCSACHLGGPATVPLRGRQLTSFRPGMPLTDYRIDYRFTGANEQMTVVGHVEQLRQSACYQKSPDMTCLTCHDPHQRARPDDSIAFYREKCLSCHEKRPCGLDRAQRLRKDRRDSCAGCHMPRGDTEIPHIAFTHHRIGRHAKPLAADPGRAPDLVPSDSIAHLPPLDRRRNLGLAYLQVYRNPVHAEHAEAFRERAREHLEAVRAAGLRDGETAQALAELYWKQDPAQASVYAREALDAKDVPATERALALLLLADFERQERNPALAISLLEELVRRRRFAEDWRLLGVSYLDDRQPQWALSALQRALDIRPYRHTTHLGLADAYHRLGDARRAQEHLRKARWLLEHRQD